MDKGKDDRIGNLQWYAIHSEFLNRFKDLCTLGDFQVKDLMITRKEAASHKQKYKLMYRYNHAHVNTFSIINTELQEQELIAGFMHFNRSQCIFCK